MLTIYHRTVKEPKTKTLDKIRAGSWVHAEAPTQDELDNLSQELRMERSLLVDALDPFEVPRIEVEDGVIYIFTRVPVGGEKETRTVPLLVAVGNIGLLTLSSKHLPLIDRLTSGKVLFFTTQKIKFFLQIFFAINQSYMNRLTTINRHIQSMSVGLDRVRNEDIMQFVVFEGVLNDFVSALIPTNTILQNVLSGKFFKLYEEDHDLVEDLLLANNQLVEMAKGNLKTIVNIRSAYSTIMTNNLNRVIKLLTALTIVLTIPTMIASFYGMNVALPFEGSHNAFWIILGLTVAISVTILTVFARNRWL
jgi:magnesium transporter